MRCVSAFSYLLASAFRLQVCAFIALLSLFGASAVWAQGSTSGEWTWIDGSSTIPGNYAGQPGVYGTLGTPAAGNIPGGRYDSSNWTDLSGNFWLFGGESATGCMNDLWEFNPSSELWTWMGGSSTGNQNGIYGTLGTTASGNAPGSRYGAVSWTDGSGNLWLFGGYGLDANGLPGYLNDLWALNVATKEWTWMGGSNTLNQNGVYGKLETPAPGNIPGSRWGAVSWSDGSGNLWLFGGEGYDSAGQPGYLNDLWEFNAATKEWTWMGGSSSVPGPCCQSGQAGVYGVLGTPATGNTPGGRYEASGLTDESGNLWLLGGEGEDSTGTFGYLNDLWEFNPSLNQWIWMGGDSTVPDIYSGWPGVYGALGYLGAANAPGGRDQASSWTDSSGNFWLFGGFGATPYGCCSYLNDVWEFNLPFGQWAWMGGGNTGYQEGVYGTLGVPDAGNVPGSRLNASSWRDGSGNLWLFGGFGIDSALNVGYLNDVWEFEPSQAIKPPAPPPAFSVPAGIYTSVQTVTITDSVAGATIFYTTNGNPPTTSSTVYSGPVTVAATETLQAIATATGLSPSPITSATYTVDLIVASPSFSPAGGNYATGQSVSLADATPGAAIYFTTDGSTPSASSPLYRAPIVVNRTTTIEAIGVDPGYSNSLVAKATYTIGLGASQGWAWMGGSNTPNSIAVYGTLGIPDPTNVPGSRQGATSSTDPAGNLWLTGGYGLDSTGSYGNLNDLWEFNPSTGAWTWMSGSNVSNQSPVYGVSGVPNPSNVPGPREYANQWNDASGNLWLFGGFGITANGTDSDLNDLWKFHPSTREWTWMGGSSTGNQSGVYGRLGTPAPANSPGSREEAIGWTDSNGNFWLFGGDGPDSNGAYGNLNDLWEFNPSTNEWTWVGGSNQNGQPGVYGTLGMPAAGNTPGGRYEAVSWVDNGGNFWLFGGYGFDSAGKLGFLNDLWEFNPSAGQWTWMGGSSTIGCDNCGQPGVYGTLGVPSASNVPGGRQEAVSWTDRGGNLWLFGGQGYATLPEGISNLNDLWEFSPSTLAWTWMGGSSGFYQNGVYGTLGVASTGNTPGARYTAVSWTDQGGNFWLFGGSGNSSSGYGYLNDLWEYQPTANTTQTAAPSFSPPGGAYPSPQTVSLIDVTPGATIYYTTDGSTPTTNSSIFAQGIYVSSAETIQAMAIAPGHSASAVASATYTLQAAAPTFSPGPGTYATPPSITLSDVTPGAAIYYTVDGTTPTASSTQYTSAIAVSTATTIEAIAVAAGYANSPVASATYQIGSSASEWTWMGGSNTWNGAIYGEYGTLGAPSVGNSPGGRQNAATWTDSSGNEWVFGGQGYDSNANLGFLNDLWTFNSSTHTWTWMGGSSTIPGYYAGQPGVYGTLGTPAAGNIPGGRYYAGTWTDQSGNLWLFGGESTAGWMNDLWEFNPSSKLWTWTGGSNSSYQKGVYGTPGTPAAGNVPGSRYGAVSWTDGSGNFWLFGGYGNDSAGQSGYLNDLWEFNVSTNQWTWMAGSSALPGPCCQSGQAGVYGVLGTPASGNLPGGRWGAVNWIDGSGNLWLFGGEGEDSTGTFGNLNDLWEFNLSTNQWVWMGGGSTVPGPNSGLPGVYGTQGFIGAANTPGGRDQGSAWTDSSGNLWLFGGFGATGSGCCSYLNEVWEFKVSAGQWAWMGGSNTGYQEGVYGTLGVPGAGNIPGSRYNSSSWRDGSGNLWLFGGFGIDSASNVGFLNDVWEYQPSQAMNPPAPAPTFSVPGGTYTAVQTVTISDSVADATFYYTTDGTTPTTSSTVYSGPVTVSSTESLQAMATAPGWSPSPVASASYTLDLIVAPPSFSPAPGNYATGQSITLADATQGAAIYFTTDGSTPTASSSLYSAPIIVNQTTTIEAIGVAPGYANSLVSTARYTIGLGPSQGWAWMGGSNTPNILGVYGTPGIADPANVPGSREGATSSTDGAGNLWLMGGDGYDSTGQFGYLGDLWEFNPASGAWTWMSGSNLGNPSPLYGVLGVANPSNVPGPREYANQWNDASGNVWLFGGLGDPSNGSANDLNDLWEFNPSTREWTWMGGSSIADQSGVYGALGTPAPGNIPGSRNNAVNWNDGSGNLWLFGGNGIDSTGTYGYLNDLWEFNPSTNEWAWMGGSILNGQPGVYGKLGVTAAGNMPGSRDEAVSWLDNGGNLWLFGGYGFDSAGKLGDLNDLWEFSPSTDQWTWMAGSSTIGCDGCGQPGVYGTLGAPSASSVPGGRQEAVSWTDRGGNLWLFGGIGFDTSPEVASNLNDLWEFSPSAGVWAWMGGSNSFDQVGMYGALGVAYPGNIPGARYTAVSWTDLGGNFWLFGGFGVSSSGFGDLNDLWEYQPFADATQTAAPSFSLPGGAYPSPLTVGLSDVTPGATIYFTTDGSTPTTNSNVYSNGIYVSTAETIQAMAVAPNHSASAGSSASYALQAAAPIFSPGPGTYATAQSITLSDVTPGAAIYFTTDGTTPTTSSTQYTAAIAVSTATNIQAIAVAAGYTISPVASGVYQIGSSVSEWTWMGGSSTWIGSTNGVYGSLGVPSTANIPGGRSAAGTWTDSTGKDWIFGGQGYDSSGNLGFLNDMWSFNPSTGAWTWMGGSSTIPGYYAGQPGVYGTLGASAAGNIPGGRYYASTWTDRSGNFWLFGGDSAIGWMNDLWEFNPSSNLWTWMGGSNSPYQNGVFGTLGTPATGNVPGSRFGAVSWTDGRGNLLLFGGYGLDVNGLIGYLNDLWEFNISTKEWTWMGGSSAVPGLCCQSGQSGVYGVLGTPASGNIPGGRWEAVSWTDGSGNLWLFGGEGEDSAGTFGYLNDLWEFNLSANQWTWKGGSSTVPGSDTGQPGTYGTQGYLGAANAPGGRYSATAWTDLGGNLWLFGGFGQDASGNCCQLNDVWEFQTSAGQWAWMGGINSANQSGVYGTLGVPGAGNVAGSRYNAGVWPDASGNLWLFGGFGIDSADGLGYLNDLWEYQPGQATVQPAAPLGNLEQAIDSVTGSAIIPSTDTLFVSGWVADPADGSPLGNVEVYIDGVPVGTPTLGISRPDVASYFNNPAYANSGFDFTYSASLLSAGAHAVTVVGTNSHGVSTTLGPLTITVTYPAPVGNLEQAIDSVTRSTTIPSTDMLFVSGWVADPTDGSPLSNVRVYIDSVVVGTPTLGISRPDVASYFNNPAYANSGFSFTYSASLLSAGIHAVTVVGTNSHGVSTTLGPLDITVTYRAPVGNLEQAADAATGATTIPATDTLFVSGWVADPLDGSPMSNVKVYIDGVPVGTPTLGISRPDVASYFNNPSYGKSGFTFTYSASLLSTGAHAVTVVAINSHGVSTTLGPLNVTVTAVTTLNVPPIGSLDLAVDSVTARPSISQQNGTLFVSGWAADYLDNGPARTVTILIDGNLGGLATLGLPRPDVAAYFNNPAWTNTGFSFTTKVSGFTPGSHEVSAIATDSLNLSTTLGPLTITITTP